MGSNLWGSETEPQQEPKPLSNQQKLRQEFGDRSE